MENYRMAAYAGKTGKKNGAKECKPERVLLGFEFSQVHQRTQPSHLLKVTSFERLNNYDKN